MIYIITADTKTYRQERFAEIDTLLKESERIVLDDNTITFLDLEQYVYPSLFSATPPTVVVRFLLSTKQEYSTESIKKIMASPTIFIFEDFSLPATTLAPFKKHGAIIQSAPKEKKETIKSPIFTMVEKIITAQKKDRWIAYQHALETNSSEALIGLLYWKLRDCIQKDVRQRAVWEDRYRSLMQAHAQAWINGTPLAYAIEKVILTW